MIYTDENDKSTWKISEYDHMVTLINHADMDENFKDDLALAIVNSTIEENKRANLSDILFSVTTLDFFQLEWGDFKKLYPQCPEPPISIVQLDAVSELLDDNLEDLYEFIENTFVTEKTQQSVVALLLKITPASTASDIEQLYTELKKQERSATISEKTFIQSISYFVTGLQGKDENKLIKSTYSKTKLSPEQISHIFTQFLYKKFPALKPKTSSSATTSEKRKIESIDLTYSDEEDVLQPTKKPFLLQFAEALGTDLTNFMKEHFGHSSDDEKERNDLKRSF
ncbi:hypothetical protein [Candidatus Berkiella aquae]|uniref:Uncharacterized protein n=1 Tax=Candidatus Berkiella aquae TaxID=295108 RepID=A0A0Q9YPU3_9GAMM|nr:hypothetical protein [Candidatus Berkiella aquae]MCS5711844.1 hypothetical protein [Candidatus Berkiella aquae]